MCPEIQTFYWHGWTEKFDLYEGPLPTLMPQIWGGRRAYPDENMIADDNEIRIFCSIACRNAYLGNDELEGSDADE